MCHSPRKRVHITTEVSSAISLSLSLFILSNETVNIWSHLLGFLLFFTLGIYDLTAVLPAAGASREDFVICSVCLFCFQVGAGSSVEPLPLCGLGSLGGQRGLSGIALRGKSRCGGVGFDLQ